MSWKDLLAKDEAVVFPWIGGRSLRLGEQVWTIEGKLPAEQGWWTFECGTNRKARWKGEAEPAPEKLKHVVKGYLVGDRLVADDATVDPDPLKIVGHSEGVFLIEPGLDRFVRVAAGRLYEEGPLVYKGIEFPLGPEQEIGDAFLVPEFGQSMKAALSVKGVPPALDAAYRMEVWQRVEAEKRRAEAERRRREEEQKRAAEERRKNLIKQLGDGAGRREMAKHDFGAAAKAALAMSGAVYLDHRQSRNKNEMVVKFRFLGERRFECTCDARTLQIIDSGICLNAHYDDPDFDVGTKGDTFFTLESLPGVIAQAERERRLVVFRRVD